MASRLGPDSPIHATLSWIAALILANLVCVAISLPILTTGIGLLLTAVVAVRLIDSESTAVLPALVRVARGAGLAASLLFLAEALLALLLAWEWVLASRLAGGPAPLLARAVVVFVVFALAIVHVWVWPLMAYRLIEKDRIAVRELPMLVRASMIVGLAKIPRTILALLVTAAPIVLATVSLPWAIRAAFWFAVFGIAFAMYVSVLAAHPVLRSAITPDEDPHPDSRE
ncbi:hypothetical protein [Schaalia hyovaginalis]|uniref:hypothetical protein n=1 Tax=Schaalia hyovaginalis TaxID=29316 RepID=UPI002A75A1AE|nr:hypothetical protein [Schaalia hyovaginalis]MDY2668807.1 hypothetical protein [Schaalia hyovaginalis]